MATRALAAAVSRRPVAGQIGFPPALASSTRRGGEKLPLSDYSRRGAHTQAEERNADHDASVTAAQVEAALNSKNVEEVVGARAATVLPDEVMNDADAASWVPDQDTGVFVPAEEAATGNGDANGASAAPSILDQTVFNREEEIEDVERPAVDMANGGAAK